MFGDLEKLRRQPIPPFESLTNSKKSYRDWPLNESAPLYAEALVPAADFGLLGRNHYVHDMNPPYWAAAPGAIDALLLRPGVGERLAQVDSRLCAQGLCLFLYDAWRPRAVQAYFYEQWAPRQIAQRRPDLHGAALLAEVGKYWAAPTDDPRRPAPHATGAAIDLTIRRTDGEAL
ncbi:MAG: M15 family metallopeptidase, partial [Hyphomonadaceae bacterium]